MCCENGSGTYKLLLLCVGMVKEPEYDKGNEIKCFQVDYYSHELASESGKILYKWFHDSFVLAVKGHLKSHNITQPAILLFCRISSYPNEMLLKSSDGQISVQYM